jgi:hypothetical protein
MTTADYPDSPTGASLGTGLGGVPGGDAGSSSAGAKEQAKQAAGTAADEGRHVAGVASEQAQRVATEAKSQVRGLVDQATSQVEEQSRTQLDRLAQTLRSYGDDLEKMAVQSDGPASGLAHEAADRVRGLSSHLEGRAPRDLLDDVRGFARRRPGTFLLGALAAGVVAGRLTRGAKEAQSGSNGSTYDGSYGSTYDRSYDGGYAGSYGGLETGTASTRGSVYGSPVAADVTSPGDPLTTGAAAPSSGAVRDVSTQGHGTATGEPLAGTGTPETDPVYPAGSGVPGDGGARGDLS